MSNTLISPDRSAPLESRAGARARVWLLLAICLALFLPGFFTLQPMDRDEPRFAQATKQMLETGDYVAIRFQDEARNKKPVGIYWMQAAVVRAAEALGVPDARRQVFLYRLPSLIGAIALVLLTYWAALALVSERAAFAAALLLASTILLGVEARLAKTDAVIGATVAAAMGVLARHWMRGGSSPADWRLPAAFWTAIGVGVLVKGPITPMVPALAIAAILATTRSPGWLRGLRPIAGLLWTLLLVAPWFILIMIETRGAFLADSLGQDMLGKVAQGQEAHGAPPGAYLATFGAIGWPMAPLALLAAPFAWRNRRDPAVLFLLAWAVPAWLVFEAVPTKLPHYVLPTYPALAILAALALERGALAAGAWWGRALLWLVPGIAVVLVAAGLAGWIAFGLPPGALYFVAAPLVLWQAWRVGGMIRAGALEGLPVGAVLLAFLAYVMAYGGIMTGPVFTPLRMSPRLAAAAEKALQEAGDCREVSMASAGFSEPSLVFLTRTALALGTGETAGRFLAAGPCRLAFVDIRQEPAFRSALGERTDVRLAGRVQGINLNGGRRLDIGLYLRQGGGP